MKEKICIICDKPFKIRSNSHKICDKCKTKTCVRCGKQYLDNPKLERFKNSKYCSHRCYLKDRFGRNKCKFCGKSTDGMRYCNDNCRKGYWNKNEYRLLKKKRMWERKRALMKELGGKCEDCGIEDERVLDIDHIDPEKKIKIPKHRYTMSSRLVAWNREKNNLRILCANCHRIHTWKQRDFANLDVVKKNM